jgi:hypothetical protein
MIRSMAFATVAVATFAPGASGAFEIDAAAANLGLRAGDLTSAKLCASMTARLEPAARLSPVSIRTAWLQAAPLAPLPLSPALRANDNGPA